MPLDIDALNEVDTLRDGPGFDADEFVCLHRIEDAVLYTEALNDSFEPDPLAENPEEAPMRANNATLTRERVRRMVTNWNLWKPATAADTAAGRTKGEQILYGPENFDKVYRLLGRWLQDQVNQRTGSIVPKAQKVVVDPNTGEPAEFLGDSENGDQERVAGAVDA